MRTLTAEGFFDLDSGWEFEMPAYMVLPTVRVFAIGGIPGLEHVIEDLTISVDIYGAKALSADTALDQEWVQSAFMQSKQGAGSFRYWKVTVRWDDDNYEISERRGW